MAGQMAQSRTGQDKSPKAGRPARGRTSGSCVHYIASIICHISPNGDILGTILLPMLYIQHLEVTQKMGIQT